MKRHLLVFTCMLMIWLKLASIVYENGISAPTPSTVASLNHGGAWKNTIASAGFCYLAAGQGFLEPFSTY